jgi:hypothetical protein
MGTITQAQLKELVEYREAALAYNTAASYHFKEHANLNTIGEEYDYVN